MMKSRPHFLSEDVLSSAQAAVSSKEWEGPARWTEYLGPELASRNKNRDECTTPQSSSGSSLKGSNMQWVYQLTHVAEGLIKLYRLNQILDSLIPFVMSIPKHFGKQACSRTSPKWVFYSIRSFLSITATCSLNGLISLLWMLCTITLSFTYRA